MNDVYKTNPAVEYQSSVEDASWQFDLSAQLTAQTPTNVSVTLLDPKGATVTLADSPIVGSTTVTQRVRVGVLSNIVAETDYTLRCVFTPSGTTDVRAVVLTLRCEF